MNKQNDFEALQIELDAIAPDAEKYYYKRNKAAGARVRKALLQITRKAHALRLSLGGVEMEKYCQKPDNFL